MKRVKASYKTYFTNLETYKQNSSLFTGIPKPPKAKKLLSFTKLEKENLIGINLSKKKEKLLLLRTYKNYQSIT
jgi:hypothetical protein